MKPKQGNSSQTNSIRMESPIGALVITASDAAVLSIELAREEDRALHGHSDTEPVLNRAAAELREYFDGKRNAFTFKMNPEGTPFQQNVWNALLQIPFGETRTYGQIASVAGSPKGARAVGMACNKNPIMIAVPCHRVVGADGSLTGYAGGTQVKQELLDLEKSGR